MMKLSLVCLFSLLAIATASYELKFTPNGLEYVSPNIRVTTDGGMGRVQLHDDLQTYFEGVRDDNTYFLRSMEEFMLYRTTYYSREVMEMAIAGLTKEIKQLEKGPGLSSLAVVTPTYIQVKGNKTGVEFMVSTDGIAYFSSNDGAAVKLIHNLLEVKHVYFGSHYVNVAPVQDEVKRLSGAFAAEAKYWIELLKDKIEN